MKSTILVVDDDPIILEIYQAILNDLYDIHLAESGEMALELLDTHPNTDIILLDIMMPGMNGYEVCRKIRQNTRLSHVKVILVSAKSQIEERLLGYEIGADDYITKPFEEEEIIAKLKVFLRLKNVEEVNNVKGNLLTLLSHETRTPLNGILGYSELLRESPNLDSEEREFIEQIIECGKRLLQLSEKAVLLSDLRSESIHINRTSFNVYKTLYQCCQDFSAAAEKKGVAINLQCDKTVEIDGDMHLLLNALEMILDNAVKYAHQNTMVEITFDNAGDRVQISIANEGNRIPEAYHEDIFGEFFVHNLANHHYGHGLSLAIARRIAESHDGTLTVRNRDRGPVFVFDLPA